MAGKLPSDGPPGKKSGSGTFRAYISADIECCAGITHWDEADKTHPDYPEFQQIMTAEALAAIDGARAAITKGVKSALSADLTAFAIPPPHYTLEIAYADPNLAARHQHYTGAWHIGKRTIRFETDQYFDVLRMLNYVT